MKMLMLLLLPCVLMTVSCRREPPLHLYDEMEVKTDFPVVEVDLDVYWDYELNFGVEYNWREEWYYGWDDKDRQIFGD